MKLLRIITFSAAAVLSLSACDTPASSPKVKDPASAAPSAAATSYELSDTINVVQVNSDGGAIKIMVGGGPTVKVSETQKYKKDKPGRKQSVTDGELLLESTGCPANDCSIDYTLEIPSTLSVRLDSSGGPITLDGLTGIIDVQSDGGDLHGNDLAPTELTARTGGGTVNVTVNQAPDRIDVDSGGGDVTLTVTKDGYAVLTELGGGKSTSSVKVDPNSPNKIHVDTGGGTLTLTS